MEQMRDRRAFWIVGHLQGKGIGPLNEGRDFFEGDRAIGVHEAVIADLHKSGGQDVLKETADEFHGIEGHSPHRWLWGLVYRKKTVLFSTLMMRLLEIATLKT